MSGTAHNCPNCGAELSARLQHAKMVACEYCESTVLLEDDGLRKAGEAGVMAQEPSLFQLGREVEYQGKRFYPVGQARFAYANGWWDEFWALTGTGEGVWISVDEGDIAIELPWDVKITLTPWDLSLGTAVTLGGERFRVTEADTGRCEALRGEFPEPLAIGQTYRYWHLSGPNSRLVTLEYSDGEFAASEGVWIDPYEIRAGVARA